MPTYCVVAGAPGGAGPPGAPCSARGGGGRPRRRRAADLDDLGATLGHARDELVDEPLLVDLVGHGLAVDQHVGHVGVLRRRVVAPDRHLCDPAHADREPVGQLGQRAVVVEARHGGEPVGRDVAGVRPGDERVGVGRVADHEHLDVVGGRLQRLALRLEDAAVGLEEVGALHALRPGARADEQRDSRAVERLAWVVVHVDRVEELERAVLELEGRALGGLHRVGDLEQPQAHRAPLAQQVAGRDAEQQRVADLAGRAGDRDVDRGLRHRYSTLREVLLCRAAAFHVGSGPVQGRQRGGSPVTRAPRRSAR